ncbi:V-set and transmembrane domain-containing protein 1-like isoform X4 [Bos javanicus]|uniref:V-set and transmembrane domain-containing protein 1-like isoform X4 n=1 Tax=Bos javanicus TaxID=9906 RepID=UPI002AA72D64|nr:V-set and transmembrane domain-containing protein 1-like isoform X4 [Bos javanicus]
MITEFLFLLWLGLCLGNEDEENNGNQEESKPAPAKTDTRIIFVATFSCLSLFLLFLAIFFIYRCTQQDSSEEESIKSCHSKVHKQRDADVSRLERISESPDEPEGVTYAQLNTAALSGAASVPAEETPNSCDYTMVKV